MAAAENEQSVRRGRRLDIDIDVAATDAGITPLRIHERVRHDTWLAVAQRLVGGGDHARFHLTAADGAKGPAVTIDKHLRSGMARHGSLIADNDGQNHRLAAVLRCEKLLEYLSIFAVHISLYAP
jgi:hypothetical protein